MRLEIELLIKGLRCLKGLFSTLLKVLFSSKEKASVFLIYFLESKQVRFLVDSENCLAILAVDPRVSVNDRSSTKEGSQLLAIEFKQGDVLLGFLNELICKQGIDNVVMTLSKDKATENQQPFRSLNLTTTCAKYRSQIYKPQYDPDPIINHRWLNGCAMAQLRKVQFDIETEHLLNILRVVIRHKEIQSRQKFVRIFLQFSANRFSVSLDRLKHTAQGAISYFSFSAQKHEGDYTFIIPSQYANRIAELFIGKSSGSKLFINLQNQLIFSYYQEGVFESQVLIKQWMSFQDFSPRFRRASQTKMQT